MTYQIVISWISHILKSGPSIVEQAEIVKKFLADLLEGFSSPSTMSLEQHAESLADRHPLFAAASASFESGLATAQAGRLSILITIIDFLKNNPDLINNIIELVNTFKDMFEGVSDQHAKVKAVGIPDDFVEGKSVEASSVGWHMADQESWKEVWEITGGGEGVLLVTCDTGSTPSHPDIQGDDQRAFTLSVVPGEPSGIDGNFHGTHCEGTNSGQNGIGAAPNATAGSIQCLSARGSGQSNWTAQAINIGLDKAIEMNMPVVFSISIGGGGPDFETTAALLRASKLHETHGLPAIVCAAAGNSGYNGRPSTDWPANDIHAAAIASYQENGLISGFSSGGPEVDMAFPGSDINSANFRGGRSTSSGTSMATPGAAGYATLQQSSRMKHGFAQLRNTAEFIAHVAEVATDAGSPGEDARYGSGILEVFKIAQEQNPDDLTMLAVDDKDEDTQVS